MSTKNHSYKVIAPGFYDGIYYTPGNPRHGVLHTDEPLKPVPKWLQELKVSAGETVVLGEDGKPLTKAQQKALEKKQAEAAALLAQGKADAAGANFLQPTGSNDTPEKL